ncbi:MAG TPA: DUF2865 domain-containing protein [Xanthobacteraceae bacterium]
MIRPHDRRLGRRAAVMIGALCGAIVFAQPRPVLAAGLFDFLFGGPQDRPAARAGSNSDPSARARYSAETVHDHGIGGRTVAFCVRLCDGEGFPIAHLANATPIETCGAMCPASKTEVLFGSQIDGAVARDGTRYGQLENAFLFRSTSWRIVPATAVTSSASRRSTSPTMRHCGRAISS